MRFDFDTRSKGEQKKRARELRDASSHGPLETTRVTSSSSRTATAAPVTSPRIALLLRCELLLLLLWQEHLHSFRWWWCIIITSQYTESLGTDWFTGVDSSCWIACRHCIWLHPLSISLRPTDNNSTYTQKDTAFLLWLIPESFSPSLSVLLLLDSHSIYGRCFRGSS